MPNQVPCACQPAPSPEQMEQTPKGGAEYASVDGIRCASKCGCADWPEATKIQLMGAGHSFNLDSAKTAWN